MSGATGGTSAITNSWKRRRASPDSRSVGADPEKSSGEIAPDHNKKSSAAKRTLTDDTKAVMVDFFADEIRACAKRFGGHAVNWAEKYGIAL